MIGFDFDFGELISFQVEIDDLCFVRKAETHVLLPAACHDEIALVP